MRCEETGGRKFIVEMQMEWFPDFMQRVLLNASKAYVRQLPKGDVANAERDAANARADAAEAKLRQDKLDTARQMKADGLPMETIAKYTGLAAGEIKAL